MARKNPPAKWVLPTVVNPETHKCVTIQIPDERFHIAAFWGALQTLGSAYKWADDTAHTAKNVALVWRDIVDSAMLGDCPVPTQYKMDTCGIIEFSVDGGETWLTLADFSNCFVWRAPDSQLRNTIQSAGDWSPITYKRRLAQTAHMTRWQDENDLLKLWVDKDFTLRGLGIGDTLQTLFLGRNLYGQNLEQTTGNVLQKIITNQPGYGLLCVPQSANAMIMYGAHPSGNPNEIQRWVAAVSANDAISTFTGYVRANSPTAGATVALRSSSNGRVTSSRELRSGQTAALHYNYDAVLNILSGIDKYAFYFMRLSSGKPTQTDAQIGSIAVDITGQKIWFKLSDDWHTPQDTTGITAVNIEQIDCGLTPTADITGTTLTLSLPEVACPIEPEITYFYHQERARPSPGLSDSVEFLLQAGQYVVLPWQLEEGDTIITALRDGWWNDENFSEGDPVPALPGFEATGRKMFTGYPGDFDYNALDPVPTSPHMCLLAAYHAMSSPGFRTAEINDALNIEDLDPDAKYAWLQPNTGSVYRDGAIHLLVSLQAHPSIDLCDAQFDMSAGRNQWRLKLATDDSGGAGDDTAGAYETSEGWRTTLWTPYGEDALFIVLENFTVDLTGINLLYQGHVRYTATGGGAQISFNVRHVGGDWDNWSTQSLPGATVTTSQVFGAPTLAHGYEGEIDGIMIKIEWVRTHVDGEYAILEDIQFTCDIG